jgi:hypothetical protein
MPSAVYDHLGSGQYSRLIYGAIIGLALLRWSTSSQTPP